MDTEHALSETWRPHQPPFQGIIFERNHPSRFRISSYREEGNIGTALSFQSVGLSVFIFSCENLLERGKMTGNGIDFDL